MKNRSHSLLCELSISIHPEEKKDFLNDSKQNSKAKNEYRRLLSKNSRIEQCDWVLIELTLKKY